MNAHLDVTTKAEVLIEALPYIQRFKGAIFVVKCGGSFMEDPAALKRVAIDISLLATVGIRVVVVHGGGKAISRAMTEAGIEPAFRNGLRVTDAATIEIVEKTLNGIINQEIREMIESNGVRTIGVPGQSVFGCQRLATDETGAAIDIGYVGEIVTVSTEPIVNALELGLTPVVSPVAVDSNGQLHNTNADTAAAHVAQTLRARRLVYLSDVPGLLRNPKDPASLISTATIDDIMDLKRNGVIGSGMLPKVESAVEALCAGVHRVHFIDGRVPHSLLLEIFTDRGVGTEIVRRVDPSALEQASLQ